MDAALPSPAPTIRTALAGAAATFTGIGLARFGYVPLFPAMVAAGWISGAEAGALGAANLFGYLAGALGGRPLARRLGTAPALDLGMAVAALSFAGCGWEGGTAWLLAWRFAAGAAGGVLMALAGPAVQAVVRPDRRGLSGGLVISGVALGAVTAALLIPGLLGIGVGATWLALAALVALLWAAVRPGWPRAPVPPAVPGVPRGAGALCAAYGIAGAGLVPHMVYFGDLVARGRGLGTEVAAAAWLLFGVGGLAGPLIGGRLADRIGAAATFRIWLGLQVGALALSFAGGAVLLGVSACLAGFSALGQSAIALARARELAGPDAGAVWVRATAAFAVAQASVGFLIAAAFARTGSHTLVFGAGLALSVAALAPVWPRGRF